MLLRKATFLMCLIFISSFFFSSPLQAVDKKLKGINKIVIFRLESSNGAVSFETTKRVVFYLKRIEKLEVKPWFEDNSPSYNYKRTPPEKMDKICKESNADAMLIGKVSGRKYGSGSIMGSIMGQRLLNVKLELKLIDTDTKKILWANVQNSQNFISDQTLDAKNLSVHINAVSKNIVDNLTNALGFGYIKE